MPAGVRIDGGLSVMCSTRRGRSGRPGIPAGSASAAPQSRRKSTSSARAACALASGSLRHRICKARARASMPGIIGSSAAQPRADQRMPQACVAQRRVGRQVGVVELEPAARLQPGALQVSAQPLLEQLHKAAIGQGQLPALAQPLGQHRVARADEEIGRRRVGDQPAIQHAQARLRIDDRIDLDRRQREQIDALAFEQQRKAVAPCNALRIPAVGAQDLQVGPALDLGQPQPARLLQRGDGLQLRAPAGQADGQPDAEQPAVEADAQGQGLALALGRRDR
mmetsp:Transcript_41616/g.97795  ORF Transcript_41616/g.97795 Transcript_41616/m.97795 type:complete len:281 (+) Transcript_41616:1-843(+)